MLALLLLSVAGVVPAAADRLDEIKARGRLVLGTCYTAPPYCFREPGQSNIKGYDLDIEAAAVIALTFSGAKNSAGDIVPAFIRANSSMAFWLP